MRHVSFRSTPAVHSAFIARVAIDLIATGCIVLAVFFICLAFGGR